MRHPIGALLERMGGRPPWTALTDSVRPLETARRGQRMIPRLARLECMVREVRA
jgi:hypothetical protein